MVRIFQNVSREWSIILPSTPHYKQPCSRTVYDYITQVSHPHFSHTDEGFHFIKHRYTAFYYAVLNDLKRWET